jgi:hypothetical protein
MNLQKLILTENACYKAGEKIKPKGIMVHSTGANNPMLNRFVGPDDGLLGKNKYNNHWNQPMDRKICCHAFIGKLADGTVATYQVLPWNHRGWHGASGPKGTCNDTHIGFEICEDGLTNADYFGKIYREAIELCVMLCKEYGLTEKDIIDHREGHALGIASNHGDVRHWFSKHGKSMDTFRAEVKKRLAAKPEPQPEPEKPETLYRVQVGAFRKEDNADAFLKKLQAAGFSDAFIARTDTGLMRVQIGAFAVKANAEERLKDAQAKGFEGFVTTKSNA